MLHEEEFRCYIKDLAERAAFVRTNQRLTAEEMEGFLATEVSQRREIRNARIRHILLCHELEKLQKTAAQRDQQQDGMNLIDFEQLKIENTNLNEKIEERNEDLVKLRRKVTTTIHVLTHVKEKLEFMKVENAHLRRQVAATEDEVNGVRDKLAQTKRRRDHFTTSNIKMREKMPMVGSEKLLLDYEKRKEASTTMRQNVLENAAKHRELLAAIDRKQILLNSLQKSLALGTPATTATITAKTTVQLPG
ncbi:putative coiled-coil domain-containing protein 96 [Trypanosoma grayi]|uniref:putative coiled-coil domain-containing protein 96 n=1 Tax=Trypanosoma grayi TaxID=71804 RepID=UPI0004F45F3B|nr:putative coiled-coil domain-containing protein 96 [Trypanosoma grayi]KEG07155.1 putative coiled-coil domain-containing protein 96 [Trypanosoma grayi]